MPFENYKRPIIIICLIIGVLMFMLTVGYALGILSSDPDGLEKTLIDNKGKEWLEGLPSVWAPIFGWIENDYIAGLIGLVLSVALITAVFFAISKMKKRNKD